MTQATSKQSQLDRLAEQIVDDGICPDLRSGATQLVFADGSPAAEVMFIGEAPGANEDRLGRPFVGAAGKFLDEMLGHIGLRRQDVYITNIVKYRPPGNRDPNPEEIGAFMPYLKSQIDIVRPLLIAFLGRHAMNAFLPSLRISAVHGQPKRKREYVYLPLFHPAAALYNGAMRQTLIDDFSTIPHILQLIKLQNNSS